MNKTLTLNSISAASLAKQESGTVTVNDVSFGTSRKIQTKLYQIAHGTITGESFEDADGNSVSLTADQASQALSAILITIHPILQAELAARISVDVAESQDDLDAAENTFLAVIG